MSKFYEVIKVLKDCDDIIRCGFYPCDSHRFFETTLDKVEAILNKCYDLKTAIFTEMGEAPLSPDSD